MKGEVESLMLEQLDKIELALAEQEQVINEAPAPVKKKEKNHKCGCCNVAFRDNYDLQKHNKKKHLKNFNKDNVNTETI